MCLAESKIKDLDWEKTAKFCFNEKSNPDDDELGSQIVKVWNVIKLKLQWRRTLSINQNFSFFLAPGVLLMYDAFQIN